MEAAQPNKQNTRRGAAQRGASKRSASAQRLAREASSLQQGKDIIQKRHSFVCFAGKCKKG